MNPPQVYMCSPSWTLLPPPSPNHPSGSSQCTSPKHPVSCIEPGLATRFIHDIIHVSMPFSQIFPPFPSPTESIRLFYRKGRGTRDQIANICWIIEKARENFRKTSISALLTMWITINCGKFWKRWKYQTTWPASWETYMQVRKQQLEPDMEKQTGSK